MDITAELHSDGTRNLTFDVAGEKLLSADIGKLPAHEAYVAAEVQKTLSYINDASGVLHIVYGRVKDSALPEICMYPEARDAHYPAVLLLHGFESSKEKMIRYGVRFALAGYYTLMTDAPHHGERMEPGTFQSLYDLRSDPPKGWRNRLMLMREYAAETDAVLAGLHHRPMVDAGRIGAAGISMGGSVALLAAAGSDILKAVLAFVPIIDYENIGGRAAAIRPEERSAMQALDPLYAFNTNTAAAIALLCGADDTVAGIDSARKLHAGLTASSPGDTSRFLLREYPGVGHDVTPAMSADGISWLRKYV